MSVSRAPMSEGCGERLRTSSCLSADRRGPRMPLRPHQRAQPCNHIMAAKLRATGPPPSSPEAHQMVALPALPQEQVTPPDQVFFPDRPVQLLLLAVVHVGA